jgi:hypothetical protein
MMKFQVLPSTCSSEVIQLSFLKNLTTPSLLVTLLTHSSSLISICRIFGNNQSVAMVDEGETASHQPSQPSPNNSVLPSVSTSARTSLRGRVCKMSRAMAESVSQQDFYGRDKMHHMASQAMCKHDYEHLHNYHLDLQDCMCHPITFLVEMMGDIMYLHQVQHQLECMEAVIKEVNGHNDNNHWKLIPRADVPEGAEVIPSVWAMQRKQDLTMGRVTKHKARLNLHNGKQEFGMNYYKIYMPVVTWLAIWLLIVFGILFHWAICQVDFVMPYPQAPIEMDMYMELPTGIHTKHGELQVSCLQATHQHLWAKAIQSHVEQLPCHQATGDQL